MKFLINNNIINKKFSKGVTLMELVVTMAILALLVTTAITITTTVNKTQKVVQIDTATSSEVIEYQQLFTKWLNLFDSTEYYLSVENDTCSFRAISGQNVGDVYYFSFDAEQNNCSLTTSTLRYEKVYSKINAINFELTSLNIIKCNVLYTSGQGEAETFCFFTYRKCVNN